MEAAREGGREGGDRQEKHFREYPQRFGFGRPIRCALMNANESPSHSSSFIIIIHRGAEGPDTGVHD